MQVTFVGTFANGGIAMFCIGPRKLKRYFAEKRVNFHISILKNLGAQDQELEKSQSKAGKGMRRGKGKGKRKRKGKGKG